MTSKWTSNANEATCLRLAGAPSPADGVFHPEFTYPIFGDAETIYGYSDLHIHLTFASGSLTPALDVTYAARNTTTAAKIDDVNATLAEFLPEDQLVSPDEVKKIAEDEARGGARAFTPLGERVHSYTREASAKGKGRSSFGSLFSARARPSAAPKREFHIYKATWDTPGFRDWHARVQIFTLFFIEGASYIQDDEQNWEFYTIFERVQGAEGDAYHFVGYTSLYRFWCWPGKTRLRLSQFLILPPYQKQKHGAELYDTVYAHMLNDTSVCELTIEDPSEAFDGLRDACDLRRVTSADGALARAVAERRLDAPIDRTWSEETRAAYKMAPRQWARMLEMLALLHLDASDAAQLRAYRLQVKARLFRVNREILMQIPRVQRLEKLHETFESVMDEYAEITGVDLPDALLEAPEPSEEGIDLPPLLKRAASAVIAHGDEPAESRKAPRVQ